MPFTYVESTEHPTVRFRVMSYDKETKRGKLKGEYGGQFSTSLDAESLVKLKYRIVQSDVELPLLSAPEKKNPAKAAAVASADEEE